MSKNLKKISMAFLMTVFLLSMQTIKVYAASANVTVSSATAENGGEVTVTVTVGSDENIALADIWLTYDSSILEYVSGADVGAGGSIRLLSSDNSSFKITFKAKSAGTSAITVNTAQSVIGSLYTDSMPITASNGSVTVKAPANYSSDNNLKTLSISPGTLTPAFSPDVTTYNTSVPADCKRLVISAETSDSKAKITTWGAALDPGDNTTRITVTAENGSQKVYVIYTKRPVEQPTQKETAANERPTENTTEAPRSDIVVSIDGQDYFIVSNFEESVLPEGYEVTEYTYHGEEIVVAKGLSNGLTVFYLETATESGSEKKFFIYDEAADSFSSLQRLNSSAKEYTILNSGLTGLPSKYVSTKLDFAGQQIEVYVENTAQPSYFLFYGMNVEGKKGWFQYDLTENTIQNAFFTENQNDGSQENPTAGNPSSPVSGQTDEYKKLKAEYEQYSIKMKIILAILVILLAAVTLMFIIFIARSFAKASDNETAGDLPAEDGTDSKSDEYDEYDEYEEFESLENVIQRKKMQKNEQAALTDPKEEEDDDLTDLGEIDISEDYSFIDFDEFK